MRHVSLSILCLLGLSLSAIAANKPPSPAVNADRIQQHIAELSKFGTNPEGGVSRVAFSDADIAGREYIKKLMQEAGLEVRIDTAGNILGRRDGANSKLPPIMIGSHIDSVPGGGNYDGDVGVIGAIEVAQTLKERGARLKHPLEVVVFADEEGGTVGSMAMAGNSTDAPLLSATAARPFATASARSAEIRIVWARRDVNRAI